MLGAGFKYLRGYPPRLLLVKIFNRLQRTVRREAVRLFDRITPSHADETGCLLPAPLRLVADDIPEDLCVYLASVGPAFLEHRFDLLGSGWVQVAHGIVCAGLEGYCFPPGPAVVADRSGAWLAGRINRANLAESQRVWRLIDQDDYVPIDWQLDFKSGYRWSELRYFSDIRIGPGLGADIKLPWELARMQHLPQLALCLIRGSAGDDRFGPPDRYLLEIGAQILDFIATNPPRFGVNWACPMDVAIRVANWLLTFDLLAETGYALSPAVMMIVSRSVVSHVAHIAANLEWSESGRTNHYLSDIVGLLYASARLSPSARNDALLAFAVKELISEAMVQFCEEGSCYEGSTSYHRLSAELLLFGSALAAGLPDERRQALQRFSPAAIRVRPPFSPVPVPLYPDADKCMTPLPQMLVDRLWRSARFTEAVTRPDGNICQIGDTDSGRLFWLHPTSLGGTPPRRSDLDHAALPDAVDALFSATTSVRFDGRVLQALAGTWRPAAPEPLAPVENFGDPEELRAQWSSMPEYSRRRRRFRLPPSAQGWRRIAFPSFGLFILRRDRDFVAFRCAGPIKPGTPTGHFHDDNLGIEIMIDRQLVCCDPGTFVYTPLPESRNRYRAAGAHDAPRASHWSAAPPGTQLFALSPRYFAECTCWQCDSVGGRIVSELGTVTRLIVVGADCIEILDAVSSGELASSEDATQLCDGYGRKA